MAEATAVKNRRDKTLANCPKIIVNSWYGAMARRGAARPWGAVGIDAWHGASNPSARNRAASAS